MSPSDCEAYRAAAGQVSNDGSTPRQSMSGRSPPSLSPPRTAGWRVRGDPNSRAGRPSVQPLLPRSGSLDRVQLGLGAKVEGDDGDVHVLHGAQDLGQAGRGLVVQDPAPEPDVAAPGDQDGDLGVGPDPFGDRLLDGGQQVAVGGVDQLQRDGDVDPGPQPA